MDCAFGNASQNLLPAMKSSTFLILALVATCTICAHSAPPSESGSRWNLVKKQDFGKVSLRGYGNISGAMWAAEKGGSILEIVCEDSANAKLTQAKYLSDLQLLPKVKSSISPRGTARLFTVEVEDQGLVASLRYENKVFIVSAADRPAFDKLIAECMAANGNAFASESEVAVPMWLDRWDKYGFRFYYQPGKTPAGSNPTTYNFFDDFDFAEKSDHSGFLFWTQQSTVDTAEGLDNGANWGWGVQAAARKNLPLALNTGVTAGTWLYNRYRDQTNSKAPQFCGNFYKGAGDWVHGGAGRFSWSATSGNDATLGGVQKTLKELVKLPNITTILEPHGEISHSAEIFMEYGPVADAAYRNFLAKKYETITALQNAWGVKLSSWEDVHVPEVASFLGWGGDAIDLKGEWKVGYEPTAAGKTPSHDEQQHAKPGKPVATETAPDDWTAEKFDDSSWPSVVAPGHDRAMFLPRRSAVYRRTFDVPQAWLSKRPRSWIYVWDLNSTEGKLKVSMNGKPLGESQVAVNSQHWCVMEATGTLKAGANQLSLSLPEGFLGYRVYLSSEEPKQYPDLGEHKNRQWVDFCEWSVSSRVAAVQRAVEMIRQVDPNRQIDFMAPGGGGYADGMKIIAQTYGGNFKNTGYMGSFYADLLPATMRGAGLPFSLEPAASATDVENFKKKLGLWQTEGIQGIDYFIHVGSIMWNPQIRKHFEDTLSLTKLIGKYHAPQAEIAALASSTTEALSRYPWSLDLNTNLSSGYWPWNIRGQLMSRYESDMLTDSSFASGDAARYRVIIDTNSSILSEEMISNIENYVKNGGIFITFVQTGRHSPDKRDAWPISRLTGYQVTKIDKLKNDKEGTPETTRTLVPASGQQVFSGKWDVPANGLSLKKVASDAKDLMMWQDGSTAVGLRPLGKGFIIQVGCKFSGRDIFAHVEGKPTRKVEALTELFSQLLDWSGVARIETRLAQDNYSIVLRHYITNNDLYDVWVLWNRDTAQSANSDLVLPAGVSSTWAWDVQSKHSLPITQGKIPFKLGPLDTQIFLSPRKDIVRAPLEWFELQRNWWRGTTPPPAKDLIVANKFSLDLTEGWSFKPLQPGETVSSELLKASGSASWDKISMGIWSTMYPTVKHALLLKTFTVPSGWNGGKVGLWLKLWWGQTFCDKARFWIDGEMIRDWSDDGITDVNPKNALQPGTTHTMAVEIEGKGSLCGSRAGAWLWVWPKPLDVLDLAGKWETSSDMLAYRTSVNLPGKASCKSFRKTVIVAKSQFANNVMLNVDAEGGKGVLGAITNGFFIKHDISDMHFQLNVTPWIRFGENNEIELVTDGSGAVTVKNVSLEFHRPGSYP